MDKNEHQNTSEFAQKGMDYLRTIMAMEYAYLAPAILWLDMEADDREKSISTDGKKIYYNPAYVCGFLKGGGHKIRKLKMVYLHMLVHCLLGHVWMKRYENNTLFDQCADLCADAFVRKLIGNGEKRNPTGASLAVMEFGRIVEKGMIEELLLCVERDSRMGKLAKAAGEKVKKDDHMRWAAQDRDGIEMGLKTAEQWKEMRSNLDMLYYLKNKGKYCFTAGSHRGNEEKVTAAQQNASDYRELLRNYCEWKEQRQEDFEMYDWGWYSLGLNLYGNIPLIEYPETSEQISCDEIIIAIDTSGSCWGYIAAVFLRETCNLIRDMNLKYDVNIRILECDDKIQKETVIQSADDIPDMTEVQMNGWGGTSFIPVFKHIDRLLERNVISRVRALIYFTDGFGMYPEKQPEYDTIFVLPDKPDHAELEIPDWIHEIVLTKEGMKVLEEERRSI